MGKTTPGIVQTVSQYRQQKEMPSPQLWCSLVLGREGALGLKINVEKFPLSQLNLWSSGFDLGWVILKIQSMELVSVPALLITLSVDQHEYVTSIESPGFSLSMVSMEKGCIRMPFKLPLLPQLIVMVASLPGQKVHASDLKGQSLSCLGISQSPT